MTRTIFLFLLLTLANNCKAQLTGNAILDKDYYTISSNRWLNEISITRDSILECWKKGGSIARQWHFEIIARSKKQQYHILFYRYHPVRLYPERLMFCALIHTYSKDKNMLYYFYTREFQTLEDVKDYCDTVNFNHKYLEVAYAGNLLTQLIKEPNIADADSAAVQSVMNELKIKLDSGMLKMKNSPEMSGLYGSMYLQNLVTSSLISQHFNPLVSIEDFNNKAVATHIPFPNVDKRWMSHKFVNKRDTVLHKSRGLTPAPKVEMH